MKPFTIPISRRAGVPLTLLAAILALLVAATSAAAGPAFTIKKKQRIDGAGVVANNDQTTVQRQEKLLGLRAGETVRDRVRCPAGYYVVDGSPLVQQVDQGAGTRAEVTVLQSQSLSKYDYMFTLENPTAGSALAKLLVTCVKQSTFDGGTLTLSDPPRTGSITFQAGATSVPKTLACPVGSIAVDPGYILTSGLGVVSRSEPSADLRSWTFTIDGTTNGTAQVSIRCLSSSTSDGDQLVAQEVTRAVAVGAGKTVTAVVSCPVGYKGITASYRLDPGLILLGDEPQPIIRVFTLQNTTSSTQHGTLDVVCLRNTLTRPSPFTTMYLTAHVGDKVLYQITVKNTGTVPLTFGALRDTMCGPKTPSGPVKLDPGKSQVYTCSHTLVSMDRVVYGNFAVISTTAPVLIIHISNTVRVTTSSKN